MAVSMANVTNEVSMFNALTNTATSSASMPSGRVNEVEDVVTTLLMMRKPTELKKVIDAVPKPTRAVPKGGLPIWYKLGLENKLCVPKVPAGKIIFARGKIGEDVRKIGLGDGSSTRPSFDLSDPYCYGVAYDYIPQHDPHLTNFFHQKPALNRMKKIGFATKDGRAICSLKEFNMYRKYLYNRFMDRIHMEMKRIDEKAKDDLILKKVEADVARRSVTFQRKEKAREQMERHEQLFADEIAEKKRRAKEQELKIQARMNHLAEYNEKLRKERVLRSQEKENRIRQRVQAAAEMELRRKITMIRTWRTNEKRRQARQKAEREAKIRRAEDDANRKWNKRIETQNQRIQQENLLLKIYTEDMNAGANRRKRNAEQYAYRTDAELQNIRIANLRLIHGGSTKQVALVRKMGVEFEKSKRGAKGMSPELAQKMAKEAMSNTLSTQGDALMTLGQTRRRMDMEAVLPLPPIKLLEEMLETAVLEFARRRINNLLAHVERVTFNRAIKIYYEYVSPSPPKRRYSRKQRFSMMQLNPAAVSSHYAARERDRESVVFGDVLNISPVEDVDYDLKRTKDRPPTPVPSMTKLAEVTFQDKLDDLPEPVTVGTYLPERNKLFDALHSIAKLLTRAVNDQVQKRLDPVVGAVTLPPLRCKMEWGEAVECLSDAAVNNTVHPDSSSMRRSSEYLTFRVLKQARAVMLDEKKKRKERGSSASEPVQDFYVPETEKEVQIQEPETQTGDQTVKEEDVTTK